MKFSAVMGIRFPVSNIALVHLMAAIMVAAFIPAIVAAQSPNTAALVITVLDQNDAVVPGARVSLANVASGSERDAESGPDGTAAFGALPITGEYKLRIAMTGFAENQVTGLRLRSGETAAVKVKLTVTGGKNEVTVFGTAAGVSTDPQTGKRLDTVQIDQTPILGRKISTVPLLNSAFRQGKGTGDLFVNQTYFITGVGSRRATTFTLDGANNDEAWGRQTAIATVPIGAIQEVTVLTNAFSAEFGWTSGPAINIVTKSGTNTVHGEGLFMSRPGSMQAKSFRTKNFCPSSISSCVTPSTLRAISPVDVPDELSQVSGSIGGPIINDRTFYFLTADYTRQNRTTFLSSTLPAFLLPSGGSLDYTGHYRQVLLDGRIDHKLTSNQNLMFRFNLDRFRDDNPQDAVSGANAPSVARIYERASWTTQVNHTWVIGPNLLNEARFAFLDGDPVTRWLAQSLSTTYTRSGSVPFTIGQSRASDLFGRQSQFSDTLSWTKGMHYLRFGASIIRHTSGGFGSEPGTAVLGTFTFKNTTTAAFDQLTINDVQSYTQPINYGISTYKLSQWLLTGFVQDSIRVRSDLTIDLGLRYDRQTITDAKTNFAPRIGFGWNPRGDARTAVRGGYAMYYTQIRSNAVASYLVNGLDGLATYTANPGQTGFPTCLTGACLPVNVDPHALPASQLPARDITIQAGRRDFYKAQFAKYGLNFDLLPDYPDKLVNPRSQIFSIGVEREIIKGLFAGTDFVHQHLSGIDRSVDLNAPSTFDRTAPGQLRTVAAANLTRPIFPANGSVRQVNVVTNLGVADYDGLQTQVTYRGTSRFYGSLSYTLSKATNTSEPDGNGINPNESILSRLGEVERGPSVVDQRHRAVLNLSYRFPLGFTAGTLMQFASGRPFSATTGVDNNGDGALNDRPVINGVVISKSAFRGPGTQDVAVYVENRIRLSERMALLLRIEGFNLFNHANMLGRGQTIYSTVTGGLETATPRPDFGSFTTTYTSSAATDAIPAFANIDPPRMFQLQARFVF
jgi:Carboxypeptidase regulatory-like domain/TonB dependent receptor